MSEPKSSSFESPSFYGKLDATEAYGLLNRLFDVADPRAVYAPPVVSGGRTVVLASELTAAIGVGFGGGEEPADAEHPTNTTSRGGGGGGGGFAAGRPVAAVIIEENGLRVEPVVDVTRLGIAALTALGAMFLAWTRMRRAARA